MAYKAEVSSEFYGFWDKKLAFFWAIDHSVGWGNRNDWDDVMLVQYLLNKCAGKKILEIDGSFGSKTCKAVKNFQSFINKSGFGNCQVDGRVSVMDGDRMETATGEEFTIHWLNYMFRQKTSIYFQDPRRDPDLRPELFFMAEDF